MNKLFLFTCLLVAYSSCIHSDVTALTSHKFVNLPTNKPVLFVNLNEIKQSKEWNALENKIAEIKGSYEAMLKLYEGILKEAKTVTSATMAQIATDFKAKHEELKTTRDNEVKALQLQQEKIRERLNAIATLIGKRRGAAAIIGSGCKFVVLDPEYDITQETFDELKNLTK